MNLNISQSSPSNGTAVKRYCTRSTTLKNRLESASETTKTSVNVKPKGRRRTDQPSTRSAVPNAGGAGKKNKGVSSAQEPTSKKKENIKIVAPLQRKPEERHALQNLAEDINKELVQSKKDALRSMGHPGKFRIQADKCVEIAQLNEDFNRAMKLMYEKYENRLTGIMKTVEKGPPVNGSVLRNVGNEQARKRPRT